MDEVARAAGIGRATLHRHFAGRDALVGALEDLGIREFEAALDAAALDEGTAAGGLRRLIAAVEPSAGLLSFLVTENQLFEGAEVNEGWSPSGRPGLGLLPARPGTGRVPYRPQTRLAHRGTVRPDREWRVVRAEGPGRRAGPPDMIVELLLGGSAGAWRNERDHSAGPVGSGHVRRQPPRAAGSPSPSSSWPCCSSPSTPRSSVWRHRSSARTCEPLGDPAAVDR